MDASSVLQMSPRLIESPLLEDETMVSVTCGARHSAALTGTCSKLILKHFHCLHNLLQSTRM